MSSPNSNPPTMTPVSWRIFSPISVALGLTGVIMAALIGLYAWATDAMELIPGAIQAFAAFITIALTLEAVHTAKATAAFAEQTENARNERERPTFDLAEVRWHGPDRIDFIVFNTGLRTGELRSIVLTHSTNGSQFALKGSGFQRVCGENGDKNDMTVPPGASVRFHSGFADVIPADLYDGFEVEVIPSVGRGEKKPLVRRPST